MSFFKKLGFSSNTPQQKSTAQQSQNGMQSMYDFGQEKQIVPQKSYEAESVKPSKPPVAAKGKGSMFSNMKVKNIVKEQKKQEAATQAINSVYVPPTLQQSHVQPYQSPEVSQSNQTKTTLFSKQKQVSEVESSDRESVPTYIRPQNPPVKRKNSSNSAAQPQVPIKQSPSPSKKSIKTQNPAPPKSTNSNNGIARTGSRSSLIKKDQVPVRRKSEVGRDQVKQIQSEMLRAKQRIVQKMKIQKQIKNKIMNESQYLAQLKQKQNQSIEDQNAAVEAEDYDKAAKLQQQLSQYKEQITQIQAQLVQLQQNFTSAEQDICTEYVRQEQEKVIFKKRLIRAKIQAQKVYDTVMKTETEKIQLQRGKMERDRKKLSSIETQISFNQQKINELEHQYEQDLNNQTKLFKQQKDDLSRRRLQIADDIKDLQNRLQLKKQELVSVDIELQQADSNIDEIKKGFQNQYRKIVQRKDKLYEMEMERDQFNLGLGQLETLTDQQVKLLDNTLNQMKLNISFITEQSESYSDDNKFKQKLDKRRKAFDVFLKETAKVKGFQGQMKSKQDKVKQIEFKKSSLSLEISLLDTKKKQLKDKIPQLEKQKIVLVSSKNFKGAQVKSTEIKQANDELTLISSQIQSKFLQQKKIDKQYTDAQQILDSQKQIQDNLKRDLAKSQFELQLLKFDDLNNEKLSLSKYTSSQKDQLLVFVETQIEELREQLQFLKTQYGLSKEEEESPEKQPEVEVETEVKQEKQEETKQQIQQSNQNNEHHEQEPSVQYQQFNEQHDNSRYGYISASPLEQKSDEQPVQTNQKAQQIQNNQNNQSENPVSQDQNLSSSDKAGTNNPNQKSQDESIEEVKNQGYQPTNF